MAIQFRAKTTATAAATKPRRPVTAGNVTAAGNVAPVTEEVTVTEAVTLRRLVTEQAAEIEWLRAEFARAMGPEIEALAQSTALPSAEIARLQAEWRRLSPRGTWRTPLTPAEKQRAYRARKAAAP